MKANWKSNFALFVIACVGFAASASSLAQEQVAEPSGRNGLPPQDFALQEVLGARSYFRSAIAPQIADLGIGQLLPCLGYFPTVGGVALQYREVKFSSAGDGGSQLQVEGLRGINLLSRHDDSLVGDGPVIEGCRECAARQYSVYVRVAKDKKIVMEILQPAGLTLMVHTPTTDIIDSPVTRGTDYNRVAGYIVCAAPEAADAGVPDAGL